MKHMSHMYRHPERETLNLLIGKTTERFVVTRESWKKFLERLEERSYAQVVVPKSSEASRCTA